MEAIFREALFGYSRIGRDSKVVGKDVVKISEGASFEALLRQSVSL